VLALVTEDVLLCGKAQGGVSGPGRPFDQEPDPVEADLQQPGAEPVFPRAQNRGDGQRCEVPVGGSGPADPCQDVGGPVSGR
jgi:hypothetical protein